MERDHGVWACDALRFARENDHDGSEEDYLPS